MSKSTGDGLSYPRRYNPGGTGLASTHTPRFPSFAALPWLHGIACFISESAIPKMIILCSVRTRSLIRGDPQKDSPNVLTQSQAIAMCMKGVAKQINSLTDH